MTWINCALFLLYGFLYANALLFHGSQTNATPSISSGQPDSSDHQRLLHLETILDLVIKELNSVNQENQLLQLKQTTFEREIHMIKQWNQTLGTKLHAAETKITILEDSLKAVISENKLLKDRVDILNSSSTSLQVHDSFQKQLDSLNSTSTFLQQENINLKKEVKILNSSFTIIQQNMSTGEDMKRLENILAFEIEQMVRDSEEKMIKNMSATVTDLELRDRYLSLSLLDVHSNMTMFNHTLSQLKKQQERQEEQQNMTIHHLTHSLQNNTAKLSNILSHLHTRVAFTAGVGYFDKLSFAPSETIIFKQIIYQVGGGYNPMTGVFTAPKAGLYLIFSTAVSQRFNRIRTQFVINGSVKTGAMAQMDNPDFEHYLSTSNLVVHPLQVGDRVWIQMYQGKLIYAGYGETSFSVIMINGSQ